MRGNSSEGLRHLAIGAEFSVAAADFMIGQATVVIQARVSATEDPAVGLRPVPDEQRGSAVYGRIPIRASSRSCSVPYFPTGYIGAASRFNGSRGEGKQRATSLAVRRWTPVMGNPREGGLTT